MAARHLRGGPDPRTAVSDLARLDHVCGRTGGAPRQRLRCAAAAVAVGRMRLQPAQRAVGPDLDSGIRRLHARPDTCRRPDGAARAARCRRRAAPGVDAAQAAGRCGASAAGPGRAHERRPAICAWCSSPTTWRTSSGACCASPTCCATSSPPKAWTSRPGVRRRTSAVGHRRAALGKWLGYVDKYVLYPPRLRNDARRSTPAAPTVVHVCDHSNAIYVPWLRRDSARRHLSRSHRRPRRARRICGGANALERTAASADDSPRPAAGGSHRLRFGRHAA